MNSNNNIYKGYDQAKPNGYDQEISHTDFGTPCGEYLRRYWHPVALTSEVSTTPLQIKILGEDLVIFKTTKNKIGLVHKNCPHRRASLVYGKCEAKGIRCCYHGWLFSTDGEILETPGEDSDSKQAEQVRRKFKLGAFKLAINNGVPIIPITFVDNKRKYPEDQLYLKLGLLRVFIHRPISTMNVKLESSNFLKEQTFRIIHETLIEYENK